MELDQKIFKRLYRYFFSKEQRTEAEKARSVGLEAVRSEMTLIARALSGVPMDIFTASREGGLHHRSIFLPEEMYFLASKEANKQYFLFKTLYWVEAHRLVLGGRLLPGKIDPDSEADHEVLAALFAEIPVAKEMHARLRRGLAAFFAEKGRSPDYSWLTGTVFPPEAALENPVPDADATFDEKALPKAKTVRKAKPVEQIESVRIDRKKLEDWVFTHNFEKVETVEEYSGLPRDFDGDDTLDEDYEALSEADIKHTVRIDEETHSIYQAEFAVHSTVAESADAVVAGTYFTYDEYNYRTRSYLADYCKVVHRKVRAKDVDYYRETIRQNGILLRAIKRQFAHFYNQLMTVHRVEQGEHLNIDALTDMISDIHAGHSPTEKIYDTRRKRLKDIAMLFLLDQSLSADGYAAGNRIIDVEKQIAILLGEVLHEYEIPFQIDGFSSKTRHNCRYNTVKGFDESWTKARYYVPSLQPSGYTRIGPALRHARYLLGQRDARVRWVILLTDGKPNDYDRYEGTYGIADVKQALRELARDGIKVHAFAIEKQARFYLPLMFGNGNYHILSNARELVFAMTAFVERVMDKSQ